MDNKKKGDPRAAQKNTDCLNPNSPRVRATAAIGRAALWGLLPLKLADKLIRRMRRSA
jgi:hypothetical protein